MLKRFAAAGGRGTWRSTSWSRTIRTCRSRNISTATTRGRCGCRRVSATLSRASPGCTGASRRPGGRSREDDYRAGRAHYYAYMEQVDAQIGRVLDALKETGQEDNTITVATTDHGDMVGAHRMWIKGWIPYEETYRDSADRAVARPHWPGHQNGTPGADPRPGVHLRGRGGGQSDALSGRRGVAAAVRESARGGVAGSHPVRVLRRRVSSTRRGLPSRTASSTYSTASTSTSATTWRRTRRRCATWWPAARSVPMWMTCAPGSTRLMDQFDDPFGDMTQTDGARCAATGIALPATWHAANGSRIRRDGFAFRTPCGTSD